MATSSKSVRKKSSGKATKKWKERISGTTSVVNLIYITLGAIVIASAVTTGIIHFFFPGPPAQLTADIEKVTVQQNVTWGDYVQETGMKENPPSPPSSDTPGILVQIQAELSGYEYHLYSGDVTILNPKTQVALTALTFRGNAN